MRITCGSPRTRANASIRSLPNNHRIRKRIFYNILLVGASCKKNNNNPSASLSLDECWKFFLNHIQPKIGTSGVIALSRVKEKRQRIFLLLPIEREVRRDGDVLGAQAQRALGDRVRENIFFFHTRRSGVSIELGLCARCVCDHVISAQTGLSLMLIAKREKA